ncbi:MAG TPA: metalloregulator ArsR/SmtB family transcription factor [Casimicrobiaceae bacterium]|nr:metalloregulator ArsR/SmtB family transcription factor [Casimicrobiaceae bacterium]
MTTHRAPARDSRRGPVLRKSEGNAKARAGRTPDDREQVYAVVARYFGLLSEATRLKIMHAVCRQERSVSQIVAETGATQTNVSRHLSLMHQAGVVSRRREGAAVYYRVADAEFLEICRAVCVRIAGRIEAGAPLRRELLDFAARR